VGRRAMLELLELSRPPTAVFCANDVLALGALNAATARSVAIPQDLTIVGFDDIDMSAWDVFALTTVRHDFELMVRTTVDLLLSRIADPSRPVDRVLIRPDLVLRRTHGAPPQRVPLARRTRSAGG
jgi:LacI family transcriptional regulator